MDEDRLVILAERAKSALARADGIPPGPWSTAALYGGEPVFVETKDGEDLIAQVLPNAHWDTAKVTAFLAAASCDVPELAWAVLFLVEQLRSNRPTETVYVNRTDSRTAWLSGYNAGWFGEPARNVGCVGPLADEYAAGYRVGQGERHFSRPLVHLSVRHPPLDVIGAAPDVYAEVDVIGRRDPFHRKFCVRVTLAGKVWECTRYVQLDEDDTAWKLSLHVASYQTLAAAGVRADFADAAVRAAAANKGAWAWLRGTA